MSAIPPNWLASSIQGHGAQKRAAETQQKERAAEIGRDDPFTKTLDNAIENADRDSEVHADAEGQGGQGRNSGEHTDEKAKGDTHEAAGPGSGLDVQA